MSMHVLTTRSSPWSSTVLVSSWSSSDEHAGVFPGGGAGGRGPDPLVTM